MAIEKTLTIIKPDSTAKNRTGAILAIIEENGFEIIAMKQMKLDRDTAQKFYQEHEGKSFFGNLVEYMTSGAVVIAALMKENAIADFRALMGATNPEDAAEGTIRKKYGESIQFNAIHGSANLDDAAQEVSFFFGIWR